MRQNESVIMRSYFDGEYVDMVDVSLASVYRAADMFDDFSMFDCLASLIIQGLYFIVCSCYINRYMFNSYHSTKHKMYKSILY